MVKGARVRYAKAFFKRLLVWMAVWAIIGGIDGSFAVGGANGIFGGLVCGGIVGAIGILTGSLIAAAWLFIGAMGSAKKQMVIWGIVGLSLGLVIFIGGLITGDEDFWILGPICVATGAIAGVVGGGILGLTLAKVSKWGIGDENRERIIVWGIAGALVGAAVSGIINIHAVMWIIQTMSTRSSHDKFPRYDALRCNFPTGAPRWIQS